MKRVVVKASIRRFKADIVLLQGLKLSSVEDNIMRDMWSGRLVRWVALDASCSAGGILVLRNSMTVEVGDWWSGSFSASARVKDLEIQKVVVVDLSMDRVITVCVLNSGMS